LGRSPQYKKCTLRFLAPKAAQPLAFHTKENIAKHPAVDGYFYFDLAQLQRDLWTIAQAANNLRQAATEED
jgi:hypothetical protein